MQKELSCRRKMSNETILVRPYDWKHYDGKSEDGFCTIAAWCFDKDSNPLLVRFEDNKIYGVLELPGFIDEWNYNMLDKIFAVISLKMSNREPLEYKYKYMEKLYYHKRGLKTHFMYLVFKNYSDVMKCKNILEDPISVPSLERVNDEWSEIKFNFHEYSILPHVRLMTKNKLVPCQWFEVQVREPTVKISSIKEYIAKTETIKPVKFEISDKWLLYPKILAFDIETYSHKPLIFPNKNFSKDVIFNISLVHQRIGKPETRRSEIIVLGDVGKIQGDIVHKVDTEIEAINKFCELVAKIDPDVVTGYNIFGFDYPYMSARIYRKLLNFPRCGRLYAETKMGNVSVVLDKKIKYGCKELCMSGRMNIDLFVYAKVTLILDTYKLNVVSNYLLKEGKHDVSPRQMFAAYKRQDSVRNKILEIDPKFTYKNPKIPEQFLVEYEEAKNDMTVVTDYCVEDSALCVKMFDVLNMWQALTEESNVNLCNMKEVHTMGKQKKILASISRECYNRNLVMDSCQEGLTGYEGGSVAKPVPGLKKNVCCVDFNSLYPTIMKAYNICMRTLLHPDVDPKNINKDDYTVLEVVHKGEFVTKYFKKSPEGIIPEILERYLVGRAEIRARLKKEKNALLKVVLDKRQNALKVAANSIYGTMGSSTGLLQLFFGAVLTTSKARESIKKVNDYLTEKGVEIIYGDTDSSMITLTGSTPEELFKMADHITSELTKLFPKPMSVGVDWIAKDYLLICKKKYVARLYETRTVDGKVVHVPSEKLYTKGVMMARRDSSKYVKAVGEQLVTMMFDGRSSNEIIDMIFQKCLEHMRGDVGWRSLLTAVKVGFYDADSHFYLSSFAEKMKRLGKPIEPGSRVNYIIVKNVHERMIIFRKSKWSTKMEKSKISHRLELGTSILDNSGGVGDSLVTEEHFELVNDLFYEGKSEDKLSPNRLLYLKKFINPLDQLFDVGFSEKLADKIKKREKRIFSEIIEELVGKINGRIEYLVHKIKKKGGKVSPGKIEKIEKREKSIFIELFEDLGIELLWPRVDELTYENLGKYLANKKFKTSYNRELNKIKRRKYCVCFSPMKSIHSLFKNKDNLVHEISYRVKKV